MEREPIAGPDNQAGDARRPALTVYFPRPSNTRQPVKGHLPRFEDLLPRHWRRRVVIQGQCYWLPG